MTKKKNHYKVIKRNYYDLRKRRGGKEMAVPKRRTSKSRKKKRRTHKGLNVPGGLSYDSSVGEYRMSHRVSKDGYYKGRKVIDK